MNYIKNKYDDEYYLNLNDTRIKGEVKSTNKNKQSCLTCGEENPKSYICAICHNGSEWHR